MNMRSVWGRSSFWSVCAYCWLIILISAIAWVISILILRSTKAYCGESGSPLYGLLMSLNQASIILSPNKREHCETENKIALNKSKWDCRGYLYPSIQAQWFFERAAELTNHFCHNHYRLVAEKNLVHHSLTAMCVLGYKFRKLFYVKNQRMYILMKESLSAIRILVHGGVDDIYHSKSVQLFRGRWREIIRAWDLGSYQRIQNLTAEFKRWMFKKI